MLIHTLNHYNIIEVLVKLIPKSHKILKIRVYCTEIQTTRFEALLSFSLFLSLDRIVDYSCQRHCKYDRVNLVTRLAKWFMFFA